MALSVWLIDVSALSCIYNPEIPAPEYPGHPTEPNDRRIVTYLLENAQNRHFLRMSTIATIELLQTVLDEITNRGEFSIRNFEASLSDDIAGGRNIAGIPIELWTGVEPEVATLARSLMYRHGLHISLAFQSALFLTMMAEDQQQIDEPPEFYYLLTIENEIAEVLDLEVSGIANLNWKVVNPQSTPISELLRLMSY